MANKLNIKVNTKLYSVELSSDDPITALKEMNKFLQLATEEFDNYKELDIITDLDYDQFYFVPQDVRKDTKTMKYITEQMEVTESRIYRKQILPSMKLINLDEKEVNVEVAISDLKTTMNKMLSGIDMNLIKSAVIHIKGRANKDTRKLIEDQISKMVNYAPARTVYTEANVPDLIIEMILFGSFPFNED